MNYLVAIIFGIVQGLTEFLPISSSGHLVVLHDVFNLEMISDLGFDVALHVGTLVSLLIFFYSDIITLIKGFFRSFSNWNLKGDSDQRLSWAILIGTIPAALAGYYYEEVIVSSLRSVEIVAWALIIVGLLFFIFEKIARQQDELEKVTAGKGFMIGIAQAIALIPGVSRSGITIITGLGLKLKREAAARFSFLLSIPIVFGAGIKKFIDLNAAGVGTEWDLYIVGFVAAAITGFLAIKYFLKFVQKYSLNAFGVYRIILGLLLLLAL